MNSEVENNIVMPGEAVGNYDKDWRKTFDLQFLIGWLIAFVVLFICTIKFDPELFTEKLFFSKSLIKLAIMIATAFFGGLLCRHYCPIDDKGYIFTSKSSWFKVNYTRKIQHFAAYLVPLLSPPTSPFGILPHLWESLFVLFVFLLMIKPVRETFKFFMIQFNSMDRPEDRPNTLKWIILGNILPGLLIITIFKEIFEVYLGLPFLTPIVVLTVAIGDGLAEPIGLYLGKKKYVVPSWNMKNRYVRSYAGSACVFAFAILFLLVNQGNFENAKEFVYSMILFPPIMTISEAFAPHSMDTPVMMIIGCLLLMTICTIF